MGWISSLEKTANQNAKVLVRLISMDNDRLTKRVFNWDLDLKHNNRSS